MLKNEIREMLNRGSELGWSWQGKDYWLLPVWIKNEEGDVIDPNKAILTISQNEEPIFDETYDSLEDVIADGYDLERMCDWSNYSFHD